MWRGKVSRVAGSRVFVRIDAVWPRVEWECDYYCDKPSAGDHVLVAATDEPDDLVIIGVQQ